MFKGILIWLLVGLSIRFLPERRTLWFGALVFGWLGIFYTIILLNIYHASGMEQITAVQTVILLMFAIPAMILLALPIWSIILLLYNGFVLIKREGFSFRNCLTLGLGVGIIVYTILRIQLGWVVLIPGMDLLDGWLMIAIHLVMIELMLYFLTTLANSWHLKRYRLKVIIVLGAGLIGEEVTPLLATRINKGIQLWKKQSQPCYLLMSGGQGPDEQLSEAEAMKRYAIRQGMDPQWILMEDQSVNTQENIANSYQLIRQKDASWLQQPIAVVTNYFHIFRAVVLARKLGYRCIGYGAKTKFYYSMNAFLRDFVGYLVLTWRKQLTVYGVLAGIHFLFWMSHYFI